MLITCSDFIKEINAYLEGDVAEEVRTELENHMAHCRTCTVVLDSTKKTLKIVADTESFDLTAVAFKPIGESIMARIRETIR